MEPGIDLDEVSFEFQGGIQALTDISLSFQRGEFSGIVGPNASGKTTLARLLNAALLPTAGIVQVNGMLSSDPVNRQAIKRLVAVIASDPENQLIAPTVYEELLFSLQILGEDAREGDRRCEDALAAAELTHCRNVHPFFLSVGEKFRLLIASRLLSQPHYLVLDEALSMMDSQARQNALRMLVNLQQQQGLGIILLSHRLEDLMDAHRIIILKHGRIEADASVGSIFASPLTESDWQIEVPLTYQLYTRLSPGKRVQFRDFFRGIPQSLL